MDTSAVALARDNAIPILVFSIEVPGSFREVICGNGRFTVIQ
jgi:uridylate kinase